MRCIFFLIFISGLAIGQEKAPFKQFDEANKKEYSSQEKAIGQSKNTALEKINLRILLSSKYKAQDDLIVALEDKIKLQGENAKLRYLLGGANGIKAWGVKAFYYDKFESTDKTESGLVLLSITDSLIGVNRFY